MVELSYDDCRSLRLYLKEMAEEAKVVSKSLTKFANSKEVTQEYFISKVIEYE